MRIHSKPSILFILHLPPPIHGAAMVGQYIHDSKVLNEKFNCHYINLATAADLKELGKFSLKKISRFFRLVKSVSRDVRRYKPELVYITPNSRGVPFYKDFIVVSLLKLMGKKVVLHFHNKGVSIRQNHFVDNLLYRCFFKGVKVMLLSESLYSDIRKYVSREDVLICPNGIPESLAETHVKELHRPVRLLYLSNLIISKGVLVFLDACEMIQAKGYDFVCNFVGGETAEMNESSFINEVKKRKLEGKVSYLGKKYGVEKDSIFNDSDIFVFPTFYPNECFPLVVLEAMQFHLPCISTTEGAIPDIVEDGKTGFIVDKNSPNMLSQRIISLLENPIQIQQMGDNGYRKYRTQYTLDSFEAVFMATIQSLL